MPEVYAEFQRIGQQLEKHYRDVQDLEFTIERGRLYMLQTRSAKRTAAAAVKIAADMVDEGTITKEEAIARIEPAHVDQLLRDDVRAGRAPGRHEDRQRASTPRRARPSGAPCSTPTPRSSGSSSGEKVILVRIETSPDDFHGMAVAEGIITARGGATSHAAVVARQIGKPCVAGSADLSSTTRASRPTATSTGTEFQEGDWVSLDGSTGALYVGALPTVERPLRGPARPPEDPRLGRRDPAHGRVDQRRQARGGRPGPLVRRRRASACAGPSTCSARASASRSCAAPSSSPTRRRGPRPRSPPARR